MQWIELLSPPPHHKPRHQAINASQSNSDLRALRLVGAVSETLKRLSGSASIQDLIHFGPHGQGHEERPGEVFGSRGQ